MNRILTLALSTALLLGFSTLAADSNIADHAVHPYATPDGGREGARLADAPVNELRSYNFYERQADYYLANPDKLPDVIPASPGLDCGIAGHFGKFANNSFVSDVWNKMDVGSIAGMYCYLETRIRIPRAIAVKMDAGYGAFFDPETLTYPALWQGEQFVKVQSKRFGIIYGFEPGGEIVWTTFPIKKRASVAWDRQRHSFKGYYRNGHVPVFSYEVGGLSVLETPEMLEGGVFVRTLNFSQQKDDSTYESVLFAANRKSPDPMIELVDIAAGGTKGLSIWRVSMGDTRAIVAFRGDAKHEAGLVSSKRVLTLRVGRGIPTLGRIYVWHGEPAAAQVAIDSIVADTIALSPKQRAKAFPTIWPETITLKGELSADTAPYVVDDIPVPFKNPWNSVMFLSGVDFLSNGDALACTLTGEVWYITGIDASLKAVTWKRFATGLGKPFGMKVINDQIYVGCHNQIVRLHDYNGDHEADFYESYEARFPSSTNHSKSFGVDADKDGNFYVMASNRTYKLPADGSAPVVMSDGTRNAMGFGCNPDGRILLAPQEGLWTPASMIIEAQPGKHYGLNTRTGKIDPPMVYIPRAVDNSTGGVVWADSDRWGPLRDQFVGLSYGASSMYAILEEQGKAQPHAAIVPMPCEFRSGVVRGRFNPKDGQFYVAGTDGWGNYSIDPGCLSRVRYTGKAYTQPTGFEVFSNGIRLDFDVPLDSQLSLANSKAFCQQWNYEYSSKYGSPEFSISHPAMLGHDPIGVSSLRVIGDGKSLFIEMPDLAAAMQLHIRCHLIGADGQAFRTSLFTTVHRLAEAYAFDGQRPLVSGKADVLALRVVFSPTKKKEAVTISGKRMPNSHAIRIMSRAQILKFYPERITVDSGEAVRITYENSSTAMPHNIVFTESQHTKAIGVAADAMVAQRDAQEKHYIPNVDGIIAHTWLVHPGKRHELNFIAPEEPGEYPFICTFPGHWRVMRGTMVVK